MLVLTTELRNLRVTELNSFNYIGKGLSGWLKPKGGYEWHMEVRPNTKQYTCSELIRRQFQARLVKFTQFACNEISIAVVSQIDTEEDLIWLGYSFVSKN